jgi:tellurite resistance protein TerC
MIGSDPLWWGGFLAFVAVMLALDLGVFHRHDHIVKMREALGWTATWITLALLFNLGIYMGWIGSYSTPETQHAAGIEFLTGYLIELSLSVDNVFVFALLFKYFQVPPIFQHRVLFWGILGALIMRAIMIFAGVALLNRFHWIIYVFGAILIYSGIKMWKSDTPSVDLEHNMVLRLMRRIFPVASGDHGHDFFARTAAGGLAVTPLFVVLLMVEWTDLIFAVDSIPAVLAVTNDPFIVFTSNIMAILGLRSLYFALAGVMEKFYLLHYGLSVILVFVGAKMIFAKQIGLPKEAALGIIAAILAISVIGSLLFPKKVPVPEIEPGGAEKDLAAAERPE